MSERRLPSLNHEENSRNVSPSLPADRLSDSELARAKKAVGERLKEAFDTDNFSEIGRRLQVTAAVARYYAEGARFPAPEMLIQFRRVTGMSIDWLLTGEGPKYVKFESVFSEAEEAEIKQMARESGRSFLEQTAKLATAGLKFLEKLDSWKKD